MGNINSFTDPKVWEKAHQFVLRTYRLLKKLPKEEKYIIESQLKRAAISIPTNIAEGCGRYSKKEFAQYLIISRGSVEECKYLILLVKDLEFIDLENYHQFNDQLNEIGKMLNGLIKSIKS